MASPIHSQASPLSSFTSSSAFGSARGEFPPPGALERFQYIHDSIPHQSRMRHYRNEQESYLSLVDSQEEIYRIRTNEMYQLLVMFAAFQGVVFSAVSQSTLLSCKEVWSPLSLSFTACVAIIFAVVQKLVSIGDLREEIRVDKDRAYAVYCKIDDLKGKGKDFDLSTDPDRGPDAYSKGCLRHVCSIHGTFLLVSLIIFSAGIMVSCALVLCRDCKCRS